MARKKDLKKDEFITFLSRFVEFVKRWSRIIIGSCVSLIVIIMIILVIRDQRVKSEVRAEEEFRKAVLIYENAKGDQKKISEAEKLFRDITLNYGKTLYGCISFIYLGNIYYETKQWDKAIEAYNAIINGKWNKPPYNYIAIESIAYCYEGKGDYESALSWYKKLSETVPEKMRERAMLSIARCYKKQGKNELAEQIYNDIAKSSEQSIFSKIFLTKEMPTQGK